MHQLKTTLAQLQLRSAQLADKQALAEAALAAATAARQAFRLEGDLTDDRLDAKLQADVDICRSKLTGLDADIAALQAKITETEQRLAAERTAAEHKAASEKLARDLDAVEKALPNALQAGRHFVSTLEELHFNFEASQMAQVFANMLSQIEIASGFVLQELRGTVAGIADGTMPIPAPKPESAPPVVTEPAPPTRTVFCLNTIKWKDANGRQHSALQYEDVMLPLALADKALRRGVCVPLTDDRRKTLKGARGGQHPNLDALDIVDLDTIEDPKAPYLGPETSDVLRAADFRVVDRGASRTGTINVARVL